MTKRSNMHRHSDSICDTFFSEESNFSDHDSKYLISVDPAYFQPLHEDFGSPILINYVY